MGIIAFNWTLVLDFRKNYVLAVWKTESPAGAMKDLC